MKQQKGVNPFRSTDQQIAAFISYILVTDRVKKSTAYSYARNLESFATFLKQNTQGQVWTVADASAVDVFAYIADLRQREHSPVSINRQISVLKVFFRHQVESKVRFDDPTIALNRVKPQDVESDEPLSRRTIKLLLSHQGGENAVRDQALLYVLYSGLKRAAICQLSISNFHPHLSKFILKDRHVPLTQNAVNALKSYLAIRPPSTSKLLFLGRRGSPLGDRAVWDAVKRAGRAAGLEDRITPETLRTAFFTHSREDGMDGLELMRTMGVTQLTTAEKYLKLGNVDVDLHPSQLSSVDATLNLGNARRAWVKMRNRLDHDPEGAISATRLLVEEICKAILVNLDHPVPQNDNLSGLCKQALLAILPHDAEGSQHLLQFARTTAGLLDAMGLYRDVAGDAHGSIEAKEVTQLQAEYVVNLAQATAMFLLKCYRMKTS